MLLLLPNPCTPPTTYSYAFMWLNWLTMCNSNLPFAAAATCAEDAVHALSSADLFVAFFLGLTK